MPGHILQLTQKGAKTVAYGYEAAARGALEAGVRVMAGFPGNPNNFVTDAFALVSRERHIHVELSTSEKVAFEVAWGASMCGQRAFCSVNMLGANVLVDALRHAMQHGAQGGLVLLTGDDVGGNTSALEVDTRLIGAMADMPILEPADVQEALRMARYAFSLSEAVSLPVMLRGVGKVMMSRTTVSVGAIEPVQRPSHFHDPEDDLPYAPGINFQVINHRQIHAGLKKAGELAAQEAFDRWEPTPGAKVGILGCGVGYHLALEALDELGLRDRVSLLKLGVMNPLNQGLLSEFLQAVEVVLCIEEGEAFVEPGLQALAARIGSATKVLGKLTDPLPLGGELFIPEVIKGIEAAFAAAGQALPTQREYAPALPAQWERTLTLCAGCPTMGAFYAIREATRKLSHPHYVGVGDVGCCFIGILPPAVTLHTAINMGGAISMACGVAASGVDEPVIAVVGDGGFLHSGVSALINAVHNQAPIVVVLLDNDALGNTGLQPTANSGVNVQGESSPRVNLEDLCRGTGVPFLKLVNPLHTHETIQALTEALQAPKPAVVIAREPCTLLRLRAEKAGGVRPRVARLRADRCTACGDCMHLYCPALVWEGYQTPEHAPAPTVMTDVCSGCGMCAQVCPSEAILMEEA